jgi:hypothetical protein
MKPQLIASVIATKHEITLSADWVKQFRQWLISKGGKCTPKGDVVTPKGNQVHFEPVRRNTFRVSLMEVAQ